MFRHFQWKWEKPKRKYENSIQSVTLPIYTVAVRHRVQAIISEATIKSEAAEGLMVPDSGHLFSEWWMIIWSSPLKFLPPIYYDGLQANWILRHLLHFINGLASLCDLHLSSSGLSLHRGSHSKMSLLLKISSQAFHNNYEN
jgi:hypothetical protein